MPKDRAYTYAELVNLIKNAGGKVPHTRRLVQAARTAHEMGLISAGEMEKSIELDVQADNRGF